jgi:predicted DNA repair protein MutK
MAGASLLTLIDDIATLLDDVAVMSKVAAKKTAGVLGDDLALNAQQVAGVKPDRELPVVWAVAKGSIKNKAILVPAALAISAFIPWAVVPLLMLGGAFLCFEGFEKLAHKLLHSAAEDDARHAEQVQAVANSAVDIVAFEREKIKGAVRTDFILSAEIIAITLGAVAAAPFSQQLTVLVIIAVAITVGVYGVVAAIVKLDDAGLYLSLKSGDGLWLGLQRSVGRAFLLAAPYLMKSLSVIGTAAMFMVGGGILAHGIPGAEGILHAWALNSHAVPLIGGTLEYIMPTLLSAVLGVIAGAVVLLLVTVAQRLWRKAKPA